MTFLPLNSDLVLKYPSKNSYIYIHGLKDESSEISGFIEVTKFSGKKTYSY